MEQPDVISPEPAGEENQPMSLGSRLMNVFVSPGELFESLKSAQRSAANWLIPLVILILVSTISVFVVFDQPNIQQQFRDQMTKQLEKKIQEGKLTQQQAEQSRQFTEPSSTMFKVFGAISGVFGITAVTFILALVAWLMGKYALKGILTYGIALEIVGLAWMISVLGSIVTILLMVAMDSMYATPSLALLVKDYDVTNTAHKLMSQMNVFTIWYTAVIGIGLAKVSNASVVKSLSWVFGIFIVIVAVIVIVS